MIILSGDEYQCRVYANSIYTAKSPLHKNNFIYTSRSTKDVIPDEYDVTICAGYIHKKTDKLFEYIKIGQENLLTNFLPKKFNSWNMLPVAEFKDLKNPTYTVIAYDLYQLKILSDLNILEKQSSIPNVFDFVESIFTGNILEIRKYDFIFSDGDESFLWVLNDTIESGIQVLTKNDSKMNFYKKQKINKLIQNYSIDHLFMLKNICSKIIENKRKSIDPVLTKSLLNQFYDCFSE